MLRPVYRRLLVSPLAAVLIAGCGASTKATRTAASSAGASPSPAGCPAVAAPRPKGSQHLAKPTLRLAAGRPHVATLLTSCGTIQIALDVRGAPRTSASFAYLAGKHFFDGLTFHRIVPGFVIQGGDPLGSGQGGPGYTIVERPPAGTRYVSGVVAMAKTASDPAGASGSQFFIVTGADAALPSDYALLGRVTSGTDVIARIAAVPADPQTGQPARPVVITRATVS
ncbi:MAG: hypothetical protein NVSMB51_04880 [Solirubrobacteraceae bacterium]